MTRIDTPTRRELIETKNASEAVAIGPSERLDFSVLRGAISPAEPSR